MATETTNYKMTKDASNEHYNIDRVNANLDKIDTAIKAVDTDKVSKVTGKNLSTNDYTTPEKDKLAGIEANAKNYSHPSKHPASIITQDASNRFTTDVEKAKWNKTTTDLTTLDTTVSQHSAESTTQHHKTRTEILDMKAKLSKANVLEFLNKTGIGFYDLFENMDYINTSLTTANVDVVENKVKFVSTNILKMNYQEFEPYNDLTLNIYDSERTKVIALENSTTNEVKTLIPPDSVKVGDKFYYNGEIYTISGVVG